MEEIVLKFNAINYEFPFVFVKGTGDRHFLFGLENDQLRVNIKDFYISQYPVTETLWRHIMGLPGAQPGDDHKPVVYVSYDAIVANQGFLQKIQATATTGSISKHSGSDKPVQFRLPTETEWEYAARGGVYWGDYYIYSGSDDIGEVGWYKRNSKNDREAVGQKKPNQLGIYDMCGNVWEWCSDYYQSDTAKIPRDGSACMEASPTRVLRGGCFHNFGIHCTVMKRYEIGAQYGDPCIGFRLVLTT